MPKNRTQRQHISARNAKKSAQISANSQGFGGRGPDVYNRLNSGVYHRDNSKRDVWKVGGLPNHLDFFGLYNMYRRNGLASSGVNKPVDKCWSSMPRITDGIKETGDTKRTEFEKQLAYLIEKHDLIKRLIALDRRQRVGRYGGIIIVGKEMGQKKSIDQMKVNGYKNLVKLLPVYESQIVVTEENSDVTSEDFGNPKSYNFFSNAEGSRSDGSSAAATLHPSRVFAFGEGADDGSIYGVPSLEAPYNALLDWEKIRVASAEGHFKNAKQRITANINDKETACAFLDKDNQEAFDKNLQDFGHGWDSSLLLAGVDVKTLQSAVQDPTGPAGLALQEIVSGFNIPKTILMGFETGERSSSENLKAFNSDMMSRRNNTLTPMIKKFLNHLISVGALAAPNSGEIVVEWDDLLAAGDVQKLENADKMASINEKSYKSGGDPVFTEEEIRDSAGFKAEEDAPQKDEMIDDEGAE